ncbi:MAG: hypothetical protein ACTS22_03090 [Phycisphaerales bacterium]
MTNAIMRRKIIDMYCDISGLFRLIRTRQRELEIQSPSPLQLNWDVIHDTCCSTADLAAASARKGEYAMVLPAIRSCFELCARLAWAAGDQERLQSLDAYWEHELVRMLKHGLKTGFTLNSLSSETERITSKNEKIPAGCKVRNFDWILRQLEPGIENGMSVGRSINDGLLRILHSVAHANPYAVRRTTWHSHGLVGCQFLGYSAELAALAVGRHFDGPYQIEPGIARERLLALFDGLRELDGYIEKHQLP